MPSPGSVPRADDRPGRATSAQVGGHAPRLRVAVEWALRVTVFALLGWYLAETLRGDDGTSVERAGQGELESALRRWSTSAAPTRVGVALGHPPEGWARDWLAALAGAGTGVGWHGPELLPTAVSLEPRADPAGGVDVSVAAPPGQVVTLRDSVGELGAAPASEWGVGAVLPASSRVVDAVVGPVTASAALRDSLRLRRLLVIGAANWETKFVTAALEERGWPVDAHVVVSPKGDVRQGTIEVIDTTRYSAVLALDTTAARYADRIGRYVRQGGGLVLWASAALSPAFGSIAPARSVGPLQEDEGRTPNDTLPRADLELLPLTRLADDAEVLERRGAHVAIAARRLGTGRVIETGYTNGWRWRMAGGEDAPEAHRHWLAGLVAQVAHATRVERDGPPTSVAPLAALVDRLGPPSTDEPQAAPPVASRWFGWIFAAVVAMLLAEWASRRLRGVR